MLITVCRHPFGARQMALPGAPGALGLLHRIDLQNDACHFSPVCAFGVGVEQTEIRSKMLAVVTGQDISPLTPVGHGRIALRLRPFRSLSLDPPIRSPCFRSAPFLPPP